MTTKLRVYNAALRHRGIALRLDTLTDDRPERYTLDEAWVDVVARALEEGRWNFGQRSVEIPYEPSVAVSFGFSYAFEKPDDWVRTFRMSADPTFTIPLESEEVLDERAYWFANVQTLYVQYMSDGSSYGGDLSAWPQTFADAVALMLAVDIGPSVGNMGAGEVKALEERAFDAIRNARSKDAQNQPMQRRAPGRLQRARRTRWYGTEDRR